MLDFLILANLIHRKWHLIVFLIYIFLNTVPAKLRYFLMFSIYFKFLLWLACSHSLPSSTGVVCLFHIVLIVHTVGVLSFFFFNFLFCTGVWLISKQCCSSFRRRAKGFSHTYMCTCSAPNTPPIRADTLLSAVQSLSHVRLFATPWTAARQACLPSTSDMLQGSCEIISEKTL